MNMHGLHSPRKHTRPVRALLARLVLVCMLVTLLPVPTASAVSPFQDYADKLSSWNVMRGYSDGDMRLDDPITRAQFVAMVNRGYGYTKTGPTPFQDVEPGAWYADDISIAYTAGYFTGRTATTAAPNDTLSREQALTLLARSLRLESSAGEVTSFTDGDQFSSYSKGYVDAAVKMGIIGGYPDGSFHPRDPITRGQMAKILANSLGTLVNSSGTSTLGDVYGNVTVNTAGATLKDTTIAGNLYISGGLDLGAVTLDNVRVLGDIIVAGGGESETGQESVILRNTEANNLLVDNLAGQYVSLRSEGSTHINNADIRSSAYVLDRSPSGYGLLNVNLDDKDGSASYTLSGNLKNVVNQAPSSALTISRGTAQSLTVDEKATNSTLNIDINTSVKELNLDVATPVTGSGDVDTLHVNAAGSSSVILPDKIDIRPGIVADIFGETMDTKLGEESSADPRILAGYPKARDVAPTSATGVFSCNKSGTLYWAVSSVTDGSIGEEELIKPSTYGSKAIRSGNMRITGSNQEHTAAIAGLTKGGSYYLSAILVDARGTRSPLKVISFGTPDDSVPNFSTGFPNISLISGSYAQAAVMPTKSCKLYYALYEKGSTAPTPQDFRSSSLAGSLENGVMDVTKNFTDFVDLGGRDYDKNQGYLEELATYDLYLWLNDADNGKSSAVRKLTFTTVDKTPPRFVSDPTPGKTTATSVGVVSALNENGTIYWVVVAHDAEYPKPTPGSLTTPTLDSEQAKFQVANGLYGIKAGRVNARQGAEVTLNITGLQGETAYDLYYVAKDTAGNYSERVEMITIHTLDENAPKVSQAFNKYEGTNSTVPYAYTDVDIIFSEDVQWASANSGSLLNLYKAVTSAANGSDEQKAAKENLRKALRNTIKLYDMSTTNNPPEVLDRANNTSETDPWVIDYREATIKIDADGRLIVTFPNGKGINLSSGATYRFTVNDIADTSEKKNTIGLTYLPNFTTISSQVSVDDLNMFNQSIEKVQGLPDGTPTTVTTHGGFSLQPISTSTASKGRAWDMLLWSDHTVKLALYRKTHSESAAGVETPVEGKDWEYVNTALIYAPDGEGGASLSRDFLTKSTEGEESNVKFQDLNQLEEKTAKGENLFYDYAFRVVELDGSDDPKTWSDTVHIGVSIVAGGYSALTEMANNVERVNYNGLVSSSRITDITVPDDFSVSAPFTDKEAPYFQATLPVITPGDTYVTIRHMLNRAGTIYYVVSPVEQMPDTWTTPENIFNSRLKTNYTEGEKVKLTKDNVNKNTILKTNADGSVVTNADGTAVTLEQPAMPTGGIPNGDFNQESFNVYFPLSTPSNLDILSKFNNVNDFIKTGKLSGGPSQKPDRISGLIKNTDYIIYFVIKGTGNTYSQPQAFFFRTTDVQRPALTLQASGTTATITATDLYTGEPVAAIMDYVLIRVATSGDLPNILDVSTVTNTDKKDEDGNYVEMTYLDALLERWRERKTDGGTGYIVKGCMFDKYGDDGAGQDKDSLQSFISRSTESGGISAIAASDQNVQIPATKTGVTIDFTKIREGNKTVDKLEENYDYILVAAARNEEDSGYAFGAVTGIRKMIQKKPQVDEEPIPSCMPDDENGTSASGSMIVTLNGGLYNYNRPTDSSGSPTSQIVDLAPINPKYSSGKPIKRDTSVAISVDSLVKSDAPDDLFIECTGQYKQPLRTFTIKYNNLKPGTYTLSISPLKADGKYIPSFTVDEDSEPNTSSLIIKITLKRTAHTVTNPDKTTTTTYEWSATATVNEPWRGWTR